MTIKLGSSHPEEGGRTATRDHCLAQPYPFFLSREKIAHVVRGDVYQAIQVPFMFWDYMGPGLDIYFLIF